MSAETDGTRRRHTHDGVPSSLRPAFRLLRWLRWLAPAPRRRSWEREWRAELFHAWQRDGSPTAGRLTRRALAALPHALALRRQRWSLDLLGQDLRYALRSLVHAPAFSAVVVLTLALAIGANVAIFSVVHSLLLQPFPVPNGDRIVFLWQGSTHRDLMVTPTGEQIAAWQEESGTLEAVEAVSHASISATGGDRPEVLAARRISPGFLPMLGLGPQIGRNFTEAEALAANDSVALLSESYWKRRFGRDPDVIGTEIEIDNHPTVVIGVMPREVVLPVFEPPDLWLPAPPTPSRGNVTLGLRAPGVGIEAVAEELEAIARHRAGDAEPDWVGIPRPPESMLGGNFETALLVLQGAVVFVLLIAGANIVNLMLSRGTVQRRELAIRAAIGAGRGRLVRQLLTESLLLSLAGGTLGLLLATGGVDLIAALRPSRLSQLEMVRIDAPVLAFTAGLTIGAGVLFGLVPALQLARRDVTDGLQESLGRSFASAGRGLTRRLLVVAEVALAFVLLVGAGLMVHSFLRLQAADPGFDPDGLIGLRLDLPEERYEEDADRHRFALELHRRVRSSLVGNVEGVALASSLPGSSGIFFGTVQVLGQGQPLAPEANVSAGAHVGPGYFRTTRIPVLEGREFTEAELSSDARVAIVSESFARTHFENGEALGAEFGFTDGSELQADRVHRVVGVVADASQLGLTAGRHGATQVYYPFHAQRSVAVILRADGDPLRHAEILRQQVWALDDDLPIADLAAGADLLDGSFESPRFQTALMTGFAGIAVMLAIVGIYGVLMFAVSQRLHEIGVRMALGARRANVLRLVLRQGMGLVLLGLTLGLLGGLGLARSLASLLYELPPTDPATFATTALTLATVGLAATALPALRATRVDPLVTLREE